METKICSRCKETKTTFEFAKNASTKSGFNHYCRACVSIYRKNNEQSINYRRNYNRQRTPEQRRAGNLKSNYGITPEQFQEMLKRQNGECKICRRKPKENLHIDHCHKTGKVRGLLCNNCNRALGLFQDSAELLSRAAEYLEVFNVSC